MKGKLEAFLRQKREGIGFVDNGADFTGPFDDALVKWASKHFGKESKDVNDHCPLYLTLNFNFP